MSGLALRCSQLPDRCRAGLGVPALRRARLDAGRVLRRGRVRDWAHRQERLRTVSEDDGRDALLWGILLVVALATAMTGRESVPLLIVAGGVVVWLVRAPPNVLRRAGTAGEGASAILLCFTSSAFLPTREPSSSAAASRSSPSCTAAWCGTPLAHRAAVPGRGRRGVRHAGPGGDHHRIHWLPRRRHGGCLRGRSGRRFSRLFSSPSSPPHTSIATGSVPGLLRWWTG